jgi:8-oxo-dGTP pyrophosphatase MutT (NUDIX family)
MNTRDNPWRTLLQRRVYKNRWFSVREDRVVRPDGVEDIYGVVEISPSAAVVALNERLELPLVGQWRYCLNRFSWEVPAGGCFEREAPIEAARRELIEETGLSAEKWHELGSIDNSNSATTDVVHLFCATELQTDKARPDATEVFSVRWVSLKEAIDMVISCEITDSSSAVALLKTARLFEL